MLGLSHVALDCGDVDLGAMCPGMLSLNSFGLKCEFHGGIHGEFAPVYLLLLLLQMVRVPPRELQDDLASLL